MRRRRHHRQAPVADDGLESQQIVHARILQVAAPRGLRELVSPVAVSVAQRAARRRIADERAARERGADDQAGDGPDLDAPGELTPAVVVRKQRIGDGPGRDRGGRADDAGSARAPERRCPSGTR